MITLIRTPDIVIGSGCTGLGHLGLSPLISRPTLIRSCRHSSRISPEFLMKLVQLVGGLSQEINQSINHPQRLWRKLVCTDSALTSIDGAISRRKWVSFFALKSNCAIRESRVRSIKKLIRNFCIFFASRGDQAHQDTPARIHQVTREKLSIQGDESAFRAATESVNLLYPVRRRGRWSYNFFSRGKTRSPG